MAGKIIVIRIGIALGGVLLAGCPDKPTPATPDAAATANANANANATATANASANATANASANATATANANATDAGKDAGEKRYDPKYKCPTGMTHFYLEGDFCRKKCFTQADCARGERCSGMEYPFVLDGGPAGSGHFCEGT